MYGISPHAHSAVHACLCMCERLCAFILMRFGFSFTLQRTNHINQHFSQCAGVS